MHPILEGSFTCNHAAEQIPKVCLRHDALIDRHLSACGDDTSSGQVQQRPTILSNQLLKAVADGSFSGWAEPAHFHLPFEMLPDPGDSAPGEPASQIVHGTADRTEAVVLHDFECIPETAPKELLPSVMFQMLDQGHATVLHGMPASPVKDARRQRRGLMAMRDTSNSQNAGIGPHHTTQGRTVRVPTRGGPVTRARSLAIPPARRPSG